MQDEACTTGPVALRPGGLELTRRALALCGAAPGARLLDLGCGRGESAACAAAEFGLMPVGLDRSPALRGAGCGLPLLRGVAEALPLAGGAVDVVLAECVLSVMADRAAALREVRRALAPGGAFVVSDVYLRSPGGAPGLAGLLAPAGRGLARSREAICAELAAHSFAVEHWEDHTGALRDFACAAPAEAARHWEPAPGADSFATALAVARARPGYFLLIARPPLA